MAAQSCCSPLLSCHDWHTESVLVLQFLVDFYRNLPEVVIFSQDDCSHGRCPWQQHPSYSRLPELLNAPNHNFARLDRDTCLCQWIHER